MKMKKYIAPTIAFIATIAVLSLTDRSHSSCSRHMFRIGDAICKYRHEHGVWPTTEREIIESGIIPGDGKLETLHDIPIVYDPEEPALSADCPHGKKIGAHGVILTSRYNHLY